jgi:hypothetical protein
MRSILAVLIFQLSATVAFSQDYPIPPKRTTAAKVGFFAGVTPSWLFVDVGPINSFLVPAGGAPLKDNGIFMFGGAGAVYIGVINNFRVGGIGLGGGISSSSVDATGIRRDTDLDVGFGGITVEYVIPAIPRLDIALGGMLGWGGVDVTLRQDTGRNLTWDDEWANFGSGNYVDPSTGTIGNITRTMSGSYFVWMPTVNVEYAVLGWMAIRVGAGYVGMSAPSWSVDGKYDLVGVPSDINGEGFIINGGIFVGTF